MNKKLVVPFLATIIGLSIAGGLGGAFAWYQFNAEVRTGFIGSSVAEAGVLQIGHVENVGGQDTIVWGNDYFVKSDDVNNPKPLIPVTFGQILYGQNIPDNRDLSGNLLAYGYPEAGAQTNAGYSQGWQEMVVNTDKGGFYQYDIYLRAKEDDKNKPDGYALSSQAVYLSSVTLEDVTGNNNVADAIRVHLAVYDDHDVNVKNVLISKKEHSKDKTTGLKVFGELDLDDIVGADTLDLDWWEDHYGETCIYGIPDNYQETTQAYDDTDNGITGIVQPRLDGGLMPEPTPGSVAEQKCICKTVANGTDEQMIRITVTVWLEGWETLNSTGAAYEKPVWNPKNTDAHEVRVGLVFDIGRNIINS